ncbi:MAG: hypothetical protein IMY83_03660 [Chloroflexi bacterium]|nr:hypothetical protein [Chloroflexota bacterium]
MNRHKIRLYALGVVAEVTPPMQSLPWITFVQTPIGVASDDVVYLSPEDRRLYVRTSDGWLHRFASIEPGLFDRLWEIVKGIRDET